MTKIIVKLDNGESGLDVTTATNIRLYCCDYYDIVSDAQNNLSIRVQSGYEHSYISLGDYNSNGVTGIIPPQSLPYDPETSDDCFITFEIGGLKYKYTPIITLKGGYQYTFNLTINNNTVKAKNYTIEPWTTTEPECTQNGSASY